MTDEVLRIAAQVPTSLYLWQNERNLDERYYLRHRIETVKRIRMTSKTDAIALAVMIDEDYEAARWWSKYIHEELNHDLLYLKDLEKHGYSQSQIQRIGPFGSTVAMVESIAVAIREIGSLGAVAYSVWVEWNSERGSAQVVERAARQYSSAHVKGARAHLHFDAKENHYQVMLDITHRLLKTRSAYERFFRQLRMVSHHIAAYFQELQSFTLEQTLDANA